jgi:ABC-type Fe3+/spermidine/putrescine transport system ATPase subunit
VTAERGSVELEGVTKRFGGAIAVDRLDLEILPGEFLSLLGPSGCGKTTTLRMLAGFEQPDDGWIRISGEYVQNIPAHKRDVNTVFQHYALFPHMTVAENVAYGLRQKREDRPTVRRKVGEALDMVKMTPLANRKPRQLSGGQQQRVALARALAIEPKVLLMDEPLSALDARVRVSLREEIRRIQTELGITALYVTHDQEEALSISDRVAVMNVGKPEQIAPPLEIYAEPATPFVAEFVGTMNRLEATVGDSGSVRYGGTQLGVDAVRGRASGDKVLVLVRPESVTIEPLVEGDAPAGALSGRVLSGVFLGPVTRIKVETPEQGQISADVPSATAGRFNVGANVVARFDAAHARVLDLTSE